MARDARERLWEAYEKRESLYEEDGKSGRRLIGMMGCDVPEEILIAGGYLPVAVCAGTAETTPDADRYLEYAFDAQVRRMFDRLTDGKEKPYSHVVLSNSTDVMVRIYFYLREVRRTEPERCVPELSFMDWLFTRRNLYQKYNIGMIEDFIREVNTWGGVPVTEESLRHACEVCNEDRAAMRRLEKLRLEGKVSGSEALRVIGASMFMDRGEHAALCGEFVKEAESRTPQDGVRIFVTGSEQENPAFYDLVEQAGGRIVCEDHNFGARRYQNDVDLSQGAAIGIVNRYMLRPFSAKKASVSERVKTLRESVKECGAQCVIFYTNLYDEAASWEIPEQRRMLKQEGIPSLVLAKQSYPLRVTEELRETVKKFLEGVG